MSVSCTRGVSLDQNRINKRRLFLQIAFWFVLVMLLSTVISQVINIGNNDGQSAYGDDWDDMSAFRQDIKDMGIETKSLVSSPLLLQILKTQQILHLSSQVLKEIHFHCRNSPQMASLLSHLRMDTTCRSRGDQRIRIRWWRCFGNGRLWLFIINR